MPSVRGRLLLVEVFRAGHYEDNIAMNSEWQQGDFDGDGDFTTTDLVTAFRDGAYENGTRAAISAVPEPSCAVLLIASLLTFTGARRRKCL